MSYYYSTNINVQLMIALLKAHGIKKVIASPGTTNLEFMASLQQDSYFEMYSCVDERSAAYMACGLAAESGEPVVITCTEATASRDYFPGMTESYHRKLPVLAITGLHNYNVVGHLEPQVINRDAAPSDTVKLKVNLPVIKDSDDIWESQMKINMAILELTRDGGGPVHINMPWGGGNFDFSVKELPEVRVIKRYERDDDLPDISGNKVVVFVGTHNRWSTEETKALDRFCEANNAIVLCDHTSKYYGNFRVQGTLLASQKQKAEILSNIDLVVHIGEETGDTIVAGLMKNAKEVWRVSPDGELRDTFRKLTSIFGMPEKAFFKHYSCNSNKKNDSFYKECIQQTSFLDNNTPELPFSNVYAASKIASQLPSGSVIHFGASNTIRAWNLFPLAPNVESSCNAGCRGIDGSVSSLIGASFANPDRLYFGVVGDLTFFYDMNALGNRCVKRNVRIMLVNNDGGNIFRHPGHASQTWLGFEDANLFIAAGGHFGSKSRDLVRTYATSLGFEYISASNKDEFEEVYRKFINPELTDKPMVFEIFTESADESQSFDTMRSILLDTNSQIKETVKKVLGQKGTTILRNIIKK